MKTGSRASRRIAQATFVAYAVFGLVTIGLLGSVLTRGTSAIRSSAAQQATPCGCGVAVAHIPLSTSLAMLGALAVMLTMVIRAGVLLKRTARLRQEFSRHSADVYCAGLFRPQLYIGDRAFEALTSEERAAVMAHEEFHVRQRDPLRLFIVDIVTAPIRFIPGCRHLHQEFRTAVELAADESVLALQGRFNLSQALMKFVTPWPDAPVPTFGGATNPRIDQLLGRQVWIRQAQLLGVVICLGLATLFAVSRANARVTVVAKDVQSTAAGTCHQQLPQTCVAPPTRSIWRPEWTPASQRSIDLMSTD